MTELEIVRMIAHDQWMMDILRVVRQLRLPDWAVAGGFVRGKVWDFLHGFKERNYPPDIDVVYFDPTGVWDDKTIHGALAKERPHLPWEAVNQAFAHVSNKDNPYLSTRDAMLHWPETATAVGVRLMPDDSLKLIAPHGIQDLANMHVKPTPSFRKKMHEFRARQREKNWQAIWPKIKVAD
jgi:hypothetical protein